MTLTSVAIICAALLLASGLREIVRELRRANNLLRHQAWILSSILDAMSTPAVDTGAVSAELFTIIGGKEERFHMSNLKVTEMYPLIVKGKDKKGNDAPVEGVQFNVEDPAMGEIVDVEGVPHFKPAGPLGVVKVVGQADGQIGEGEKIIPFEGVGNLVAGDAEVVEIQFGPGVPQP